MEELRTILLDLQLKLNSIVNRIPEGLPTGSSPVSTGRALSMSKSPVEARATETELPGEGSNGCPEQYHTAVLVSFHKWARIILSLYIDKVGNVDYCRFLFALANLVHPGILCCISTLPQERTQSDLAGGKTKVSFLPGFWISQV